MTLLTPFARLLIAIFVVSAAAPAALASDADAFVGRLRAARERYSAVRDLLAVYALKTEIANQQQALQQERGEVFAYVRNLQIAIDGFPARRNSFQQAVYQEWLAARARLTELDRQLDGLAARMREIDEQALAGTAMNTKRVLPGNRRDIQSVFPVARGECLDAFKKLKEAADEFAKANGLTRDEALRQGLAALGGPRELDPQYGPTPEFLTVFRQFCSGKPLFEPARPRPPRGRR